VRRLPLHARLDDAHQVLAIVVGVLLWLPFGCKAVHERLGEVQLLLADRLRGRKAERAGVDELVGEPERRQHERLADRFERGQMLDVAKHELGDANAL
jgi:hypothetical protein